MMMFEEKTNLDGNNLDYFVENVHEDGMRVWRCRTCGHSSAFKNNVRKHVLTHSGDKPFKCPHCPYRGNLKGNMKRHILNVHNRPNHMLQKFMSPQPLEIANYYTNDQQ